MAKNKAYNTVTDVTEAVPNSRKRRVPAKARD